LSEPAQRLGVVLAAAGSSRRLGFDKLFTPVLGRTVFQEGLRRILDSPLVAEVVVVTSADNQPVVARLLPPGAPVRVILGGKERQDSVAAGLAAIDPALDYVMIQDAARPFVTPEVIEAVFAAAREYGAAVCGYPSIDTLKETDDQKTVARTVDRARIWAVQTPQIFSRKLLLEAYAAVAARGQSVTDDTAAVEALGRPVALVRHDGLNFKITRPSDWELGWRQLFPLDAEVEENRATREHLHTMNNHLAALIGFARVVAEQCPAGSPLRGTVDILKEAAEQADEAALAFQRHLRGAQLRKEELRDALRAE